MTHSLNHLFSWKNASAIAFWMGLPFVLTGVGLVFVRGVTELAQRNNPWFLIIWIYSIITLVLLLLILRRWLVLK